MKNDYISVSKTRSLISFGKCMVSIPKKCEIYEELSDAFYTYITNTYIIIYILLAVLQSCTKYILLFNT